MNKQINDKSVLTSSEIDRTTVAGICAYKGGKLVYFLSMEGKKAFVEAAGKSISIKVGSKLHHFLVEDVFRARLLVTYMVMGFPLGTTEEEITLIGKVFILFIGIYVVCVFLSFCYINCEYYAKYEKYFIVVIF